MDTAIELDRGVRATGQDKDVRKGIGRHDPVERGAWSAESRFRTSSHSSKLLFSPQPGQNPAQRCKMGCLSLFKAVTPELFCGRIRWRLPAGDGLAQGTQLMR